MAAVNGRLLIGCKTTEGSNGNALLNATTTPFFTTLAVWMLNAVGVAPYTTNQNESARKQLSMDAAVMGSSTCLKSQRCFPKNSSGCFSTIIPFPTNSVRESATATARSHLRQCLPSTTCPLTAASTSTECAETSTPVYHLRFILIRRVRWNRNVGDGTASCTLSIPRRLPLKDCANVPIGASVWS